MAHLSEGFPVILCLVKAFMLPRKMTCHNVTEPCQNLYVEGGRPKHCGLEAVGGIARGGRSRRRDHFMRWIYDPRER